MPLDDPLVLPTTPAPPTRAPFPLVASLVPLGGGVALWALLGSPYALLFALLGPLVALGGLLDQLRGGRRRRIRSDAQFQQELAALDETIAERHRRERGGLLARHPDVASYATRTEEIWRAVPARRGDVVVGRGIRPSAVRVTGDATRPESEAVRRRASSLPDAPVTTDWRAGIAVRGEPALAAAVVRALVLQLCLAHPPDALRVSGPSSADWGWLADVPHRAPGVGSGGASLVVHRAGDGPAPAGVLFSWGPFDTTIDPRCGAILEVREPDDATLVTGTDRVAVAVEAVSEAQARSVARLLNERARVLYAGEEAGEPLPLAALRGAAGVGTPGGLAVAIGVEGVEAAVLDLVRDGPHAVVAGITGSGKSELLTTWIAALCAAYSTREVAFLLADFKGGMTFEALAALPHVTGIITDLDADAAARAIDSLRAEIRRRESELARRGARDIADPRIDLPRLVIVVDEFAALLAEHDGLHRVFADVAARGRALGMHLILGSQRVTGAMSDSLIANCPLRVALRAADAGDSRAVLGDEAAVRIPGGAPGRGRAFVRRAGDSAPHAIRVALTRPQDLTDLLSDTGEQTPPHATWLPALPTRVPLEALRGGGETRGRARRDGVGRDDFGGRGDSGGRDDSGASDQAGVFLALADDPARQRQFPVRLDRTAGLVVMGRRGAGKSTVIEVIRRQAEDAVVVPHDLEAAWDLLAHAQPSGLWLVDDADDLLARFPPDHATVVAERLDRIARDGCLVLTARALSGRLGRIADALPRRALLALATRADHVAAGGEGAAFRPDAPPGRGRLDGWEVQFAEAGGAGEARVLGTGAPIATPGLWSPGPVAGVVTRRVGPVSEELSAQWGSTVAVRPLRDLPPGARLADVAAGEVLVGDGEDWLARWGLLQELRARHPLVVDADCPAELRTIAGERALPPYARPGAGRAWLCTPTGSPVRVSLVGGSV